MPLCLFTVGGGGGCLRLGGKHRGVACMTCLSRVLDCIEVQHLIAARLVCML